MPSILTVKADISGGLGSCNAVQESESQQKVSLPPVDLETRYPYCPLTRPLPRWMCSPTWTLRNIILSFKCLLLSYDLTGYERLLNGSMAPLPLEISAAAIRQGHHDSTCFFAHLIHLLLTVKLNNSPYDTSAVTCSRHQYHQT